MVAAALRVLAELAGDTSGCDRWLDRVSADDVALVVRSVAALAPAPSDLRGAMVEHCGYQVSRRGLVIDLNVPGGQALVSWSRGGRAEWVPVERLREVDSS